MAYYRPPPRDSDGRGQYNEQARYFPGYDYPYPNRPGGQRPGGIARTQSLTNTSAREYPPRPRDYGREPTPTKETVPLPPGPPAPVSDFERAQLDDQKELILLATLPLDGDDPCDHPLCKLLEKSAQNQHRILQQIERLATVLGRAGDFVTGCWDATAAARNAELVRGDLEARFEFLQALHGNLTHSVENFFQLPESVRQKAQ
jgi:hypothetical protein